MAPPNAAPTTHEKLDKKTSTGTHIVATEKIAVIAKANTAFLFQPLHRSARYLDLLRMIFVCPFSVSNHVKINNHDPINQSQNCAERIHKINIPIWLMTEAQAHQLSEQTRR